MYRKFSSHMYKKEQNFDTPRREDVIGQCIASSGSGDWNAENHACNVCGLSFRDALELLAHAESHARSRNNRCVFFGIFVYSNN